MAKKYLIEWQEAWKKYALATMKAFWEESGDDMGSMFPACYRVMWKKIFEDRSKELDVWLRGVPEGESCTGRVKLDFQIKESLKKNKK
jgi:hypothetical protein